MNDTEKLLINDVKTVDTDKVSQKNKHTDFPSMFMDLLKKINFKVAFFILLLGSIIFSDVFMESMPKKYQDGISLNSTGTFVQLLCLTFGYIIVDLLVQGCIL
jgi:hypothetical protein